MPGAYRYTQVFRSPSCRGRDSRQAVLPDALRVNANLFQTDLCRNPGYMDVFELAIHGTGYPLSSGYDDTPTLFLYNDECPAGEGVRY